MYRQLQEVVKRRRPKPPATRLWPPTTGRFTDADTLSVPDPPPTPAPDAGDWCRRIWPDQTGHSAIQRDVVEYFLCEGEEDCVRQPHSLDALARRIRDTVMPNIPVPGVEEERIRLLAALVRAVLIGREPEVPRQRPRAPAPRTTGPVYRPRTPIPSHRVAATDRLQCLPKGDRSARLHALSSRSPRRLHWRVSPDCAAKASAELTAVLQPLTQ